MSDNLHRCGLCRLHLCWVGWYWRALRYEWRRILAWRRRHDPETGRRFGTLSAWRSVAENGPSLDALWDETHEG